MLTLTFVKPIIDIVTAFAQNVLFLFFINVKTEFIYKCYRHTSKTAKIRTVNLIVEHIVTTPTCSATKFTVLIFAVFDV